MCNLAVTQVHKKCNLWPILILVLNLIVYQQPRPQIKTSKILSELVYKNWITYRFTQIYAFVEKVIIQKLKNQQKENYFQLIITKKVSDSLKEKTS